MTARPPSAARVTDVCTVSDAGSGVRPSRQLIRLTATLPAGRVSARVAIPRERVCDRVGNCTRTPHLKPARIDRQPPRVTCARTATRLVHTQNVTVSCVATDGRGAGLADPSDAWFTLSTDVAAGHRERRALTGTHTVCDQAGNCTQAGPLGPVSVNLAGDDGGLTAVPTVERVMVAQARPSTALGGGVLAPYADPGAIPGTGPDGICSPGPGTPFRLGETTVVCGIPTAHGLKTRPIEIDVALDSSLRPRGPGHAGAGWRAVGSGFRARSSVTITLDAVAIATARATQRGTVSAWFVLPPGLASGPHQLSITGRDPQGQPLIVATSFQVSRQDTAGLGNAPPGLGTATPITPLALNDKGRLVAPEGTRSFDRPPPRHRRRERHASA